MGSALSSSRPCLKSTLHTGHCVLQTNCYLFPLKFSCRVKEPEDWPKRVPFSGMHSILLSAILLIIGDSEALLKPLYLNSLSQTVDYDAARSDTIRLGSPQYCY